MEDNRTTPSKVICGFRTHIFVELPFLNSHGIFVSIKKCKYCGYEFTYTFYRTQEEYKESGF